MINEVWYDIPGYEGLYIINSLGNVKTIGRYRTDSKNGKRFYKEKMLKPAVCVGYPSVVLYKDGIKTPLLIHRILAKLFITNPNNKPQVNHKNGIRDDMRLENLEWVTASENIKHAYETGLANTWNKGLKKYEYRKCFCGNSFYPLKVNQSTCSKSCARINVIKTKGWKRRHSTILPI